MAFLSQPAKGTKGVGAGGSWPMGKSVLKMDTPSPGMVSAIFLGPSSLGSTILHEQWASQSGIRLTRQLRQSNSSSAFYTHHL